MHVMRMEQMLMKCSCDRHYEHYDVLWVRDSVASQRAQSYDTQHDAYMKVLRLRAIPDVHDIHVEFVVSCSYVISVPLDDWDVAFKDDAR